MQIINNRFLSLYDYNFLIVNQRLEKPGWACRVFLVDPKDRWLCAWLRPGAKQRRKEPHRKNHPARSYQRLQTISSSILWLRVQALGCCSLDVEKDIARRDIGWLMMELIFGLLSQRLATSMLCLSPGAVG